MKEIFGTSRNISLVVEDDELTRLVPSVEIVVILTEPIYRNDAVGSLIKERVTSEVRFATGPDGLRQIAKNFNAWADEAELVARTTVRRMPDDMKPPAKAAKAKKGADDAEK